MAPLEPWPSSTPRTAPLRSVTSSSGSGASVMSGGAALLRRFLFDYQ